MTDKEIRVPDLGSFKDVTVIEMLVQVGDRLEVDVPLATLETEKATMDVPAPVAGVVKSLHIERGGQVNTGDLVAIVELADAAATSSAALADTADAPAKATPPVAAVASTPAPAPTAPAPAVPVPSAAAKSAPTPSGSAPMGGFVVKPVILRGKIFPCSVKNLPRRMTGLTTKQQTRLTKAVKRARMLSLLPFINRDGVF